MSQETLHQYYHLTTSDWRYTSQGEQRGFIQPQELKELWIHTGTRCNLACPFCFEGSYPGNDRLQSPTLQDVQKYLHDAVELGVQRFSFTGGEPFVNKHIIDILNVALDKAPCLVLTNATRPLLSSLKKLAPLIAKKHRLSFRVSLDAPHAADHDAQRGQGTFALALQGLLELHALGFSVSVARHSFNDENSKTVDGMYMNLFTSVGLPENTPLISFTDLGAPCSEFNGPIITEHCMTSYKTEAETSGFMCNYTKMLVKTSGSMRVYACTLVDDDRDYDLGSSLKDAMRYRIMLRHKRCFNCFSSGISCSGTA